MTTATNQPIQKLTDGALNATIWKNGGTDKKGNPTHFYSVEISRTYKQGNDFKDSHSFSGSEPLRVARLAHIAYDEIAILRQQDRDQATADTGAAH